ncbi:DnaJ/Hsp40 cysteine-rich domain superfamily protein [Perilla frutescens var. hirtella]|uniref:DnaJ/Hsp40 cysteine-rich domain superfamily protein n=1 Tax=Perilla frutescens var. hirtella TaxID=608512 RepID=A0AAD4ITA4_PERFH|nr:DnaJ/Hsp40 cysteine-rich domain superfamily protein [Perilla frutescens var. hirtella]KAH6817554.1 DnaJ/Hsp40 cysteine-rich domain superfamily protein [Perilla frutescens var. frutescens]KAH6820830.1 DnaJ/Hsp40 cysteine-rich domain superfamily protein [Perilla frutescens var. hirtella]
MDCALGIAPSSALSQPKISPFHYHLRNNSRFLHMLGYENVCNDAVLLTSSSLRSTARVVRCAATNGHRRMNSLESLFCYDKPVPEEIIEKPVGLALAEKNVGENPRCSSCQAKGAILCATCSGSGLYVDSILESQGIIVKVRCLGCGGTGNTMCSECGGRGHV